MAVEQFNLLGSPFFTNVILPFVLVFTVIFAILEKTAVLGKKKDVNAIVALILGLVAVGVPAAIGVLQNLIPVIAVLIIILFSWFLVFGFVGDRVGDPGWSKGMIKVFLIVIGIILLGIVTWAVGIFDYVIVDQVLTAKVMQMTLLVGAIIAIVAIVVTSEDKVGSKE